jgi:transposase
MKVDGLGMEFPIMSTLLTEELWNTVEPLLPKHPPSRKGGAPRRDDRPCVEGILFVLKGGIPWQMIPQRQFGVSGSTCWRRFAEWSAAGVWDQVHKTILKGLAEVKALDTDRAVIDSASVRALFGGAIPARTPRIVGKTAVNGM